MRRRKGFAGLIGCAAALGFRPLPPVAPGGGATVRSVMYHALPPMESRHLAVTVLEVSYRPGGSSPPHSHPCPVIGYVVEGARRVRFLAYFACDRDAPLSLAVPEPSNSGTEGTP